MIDTIELRIAIDPKRLLAGPAAGMPDWTNQKRGRGFGSYYIDVPRGEVYYPAITGTYSGRNGTHAARSYVNIRFSAPKLVYGNNLMELEDIDVVDVVRTLTKRLAELDFATTIDEIASASVKVVHYSKNILLTGEATVRSALADVGKVDASRRFQMDRSRYAGRGESVGFTTKSHAFTMYDKMAELRHSKEITRYGLEPLIQEWSDKQILRLEVRLNDPKKIRHVFSSHGWTAQPTFAEAFSSEKSQIVLLDYWEKFIVPDIALFADIPSLHDVFESLLRYRGPHSRQQTKTALSLVGLLVLAREPEGMQGIRKVVESRLGNKGWYDLRTLIRQTARISSVPRTGGWHEQVVQQLHEYVPLARPDGKGRMGL